MNKNYTPYHMHTSMSFLDSTTSHQDYIDKAIELGQTSLGITNHGSVANWVSIKMACDKAGIKYMHGVEVYMTLDTKYRMRDNYHTVLLARNYEGLKEINAIVSISYDEEHFYYKPRITFDEFSRLSNNVIKISACLGSPLYSIDRVVERIEKELIPKATNEGMVESYKDYIKEIQPWKEKLINHYDFLEVQHHSLNKQCDYNKWLWQKSNEYGIPLIAGTDTHSISSYAEECREMLRDSKKITFKGGDDEEGGVDSVFKTYDELVQAYEEQNVLPRSVYLQAIENTNRLADMVEDFELDTSFKYPKVSDNDSATLRAMLREAHEKMKREGIITPENATQYVTQVKEELRVFEKLEMCGFLIFMARLIQWCRQKSIPMGFARGSGAGSTILYMLEITDVDPQEWGTVFSRFANEDRKEIGDKLNLSPQCGNMLWQAG